MNKLIFCLASIMVCLGSYAQSETGTISLQPKIGVNITHMSETKGNVSPRFGYAMGGEISYQIDESLNISVGAIYSQQGFRAHDKLSKLSINMDYCNIPILLNAYLAKDIALKVGIQPGFLIKHQAEVELEEYGYYKNVKMWEALETGGLYDGKISKFDFAIPIGISYEVSHLVFDARYSVSLSKALYGYDGKMKHLVGQLSIGYKFDLFKL